MKKNGAAEATVVCSDENLETRFIPNQGQLQTPPTNTANNSVE